VNDIQSDFPVTVTSQSGFALLRRVTRYLLASMVLAFAVMINEIVRVALDPTMENFRLQIVCSIVTRLF